MNQLPSLSNNINSGSNIPNDRSISPPHPSFFATGISGSNTDHSNFDTSRYQGSGSSSNATNSNNNHISSLQYPLPPQGDYSASRSMINSYNAGASSTSNMVPPLTSMIHNNNSSSNNNNS